MPDDNDITSNKNNVLISSRCKISFWKVDQNFRRQGSRIFLSSELKVVV